jgi:hypothetical protein
MVRPLTGLHLFRLSARPKESVDACSSVLDFYAFIREGDCGCEVDNIPEVGKVIHGLTDGLNDGRARADTQMKSEALKSFVLSSACPWRPLT